MKSEDSDMKGYACIVFFVGITVLVGAVRYSYGKGGAPLKEKTGRERVDIVQGRSVAEAVDERIGAVSVASGEKINWQVISSGGTIANSPNFRLGGTATQTATGTGNSTNFGLDHGFWVAFGAAGPVGRISAGLSGTGAGEGGSISCGMSVVIEVGLDNRTGYYVDGLTHGFRLYSPEGASWDPPTYDSAGGLDAYLDEVFTGGFSVDGSGADTIYIGGYAWDSSGIPDGYNDVIFTVSTQVACDDTGKTLCFDSSWFSPSGTWVWSTTGGSVTPNWDGPHCYLIVPAERFDTVSTTCVKLVVSNEGNFGHKGEAYNTLDYGLQGDCKTSYMYDGSPMIVRIVSGDTLAYYNLYDASLFGKTKSGNPTVPTVNLGGYEIFQSGTFVSPDNRLALEKDWYAPQQPDSCNFVIQCLRVFSWDGETHTGLSIGEFIDWDIPYWNINTGGSDPNAKLIYLQGGGVSCQDNTARFGGQALLGVASSAECVDTGSVPYGALTELNSTYVYPSAGPVAAEMYALMQQSGYSTPGSTEDQFALMTFLDSAAVGVGDTIHIYTVLATIRNGTAGDLTATVDKARKWFLGHVTEVCGCCNGDGIRGNADNLIGAGGEVDVADLTLLVAYLFMGGPAPPCEEEGNVDGLVSAGGPTDVADLTYLVAYLFLGGDPPAPCP